MTSMIEEDPAGPTTSNRRPQAISTLEIAWLLTTVGFSIAAIVVALRDGWIPVGDDAVVVTLGRDVLSTSPPKLGMPTSLIQETGEWSYHPGPLLFAWLAPFVAALGATAGGAIGATLLNLVAILVTWWFARSFLGPIAGIAAGTIGLLVATSFVPIYQPLNSSLSACATVAVFITAWAALVRVPKATWALVFLASMAAQSHVAYAVVGLSVAVPVVGWDLVRRSRTARPEGRRAIASAVVPLLVFGALLWLGPIADGGQNLAALAATNTEGYPARGVGQGMATVASALGGFPIEGSESGIFGTSPNLRNVDHLFTGTVSPGAVLVMAGGITLLALAWRLGDQATRAGTVVLVLASIGTLVGTARLPLRDPIDVQLYWARCLSLYAFYLYAVAGWAVVRSRASLPERAPAALRWAGAVMAIVVVAAIASRPLDRAWKMAPERELAEEMAASTEPVADSQGDEVAYVALGGVRTPSSVAAEQAMYGMAAARLDDGGPTLLDAYWYWGEHRSLRDRLDVLPAVVVTTQPLDAPLPDGWTEMGHVEPRRPRSPDADDRIAAAVRATGEPIVLVDQPAWVAATVVDGFLPAGCQRIADWVDDPDRFATEAPAALAELYRAGLVSSPPLPPEVQGDLWTDPLYGLWAYRVDRRVAKDLAFSEELILDGLGCAP